ncbi:MAG: ATP synthase F1 subunit gamma [Myxococcales bacterium]|nr:ATP synthase F1 subunit gamma [Myxococcales bacterium]
MPSLKAIRRRIASVKSTGKITRAMKLVAAAKLRRAQERLVQLRPYALRVGDMIAELARGSDPQAHALLAVRPPKRTLLLVLTSDRGLAGAFNSNVNKAAWAWLQAHRGTREHIELRIVGKKGRDFMKARKQEVGHVYPDVLQALTLEKASGIGREVTTAYIDGAFDEVLLFYNVFRSAIAQVPTTQRILPIMAQEGDVDDAVMAPPSAQTLFEPSKVAVLDVLLPMNVNVQIYRALLESVASEMGARMTAMDSATKNAGDLLQRITIKYNRTRQSIITTELSEITSGAEALKG